MRRKVSTPTMNVAPGNSRDLASNVAARVSQNGLFRWELHQAVIDLQIVQGRLLDVQDRNLHDRRQAEHLMGNFRHTSMPGVQWIKGPGENHPRRERIVPLARNHDHGYMVPDMVPGERGGG